MTLIAGDILFVIEQADFWCRGRHLRTGTEGIFPIVCVTFIETGEFDDAIILSDPDDLLFYEVSLTLAETIDFYLQSTFPDDILRFSERISEVVTSHDLCHSLDAAITLNAHTTLGSSVDGLRVALGLEKLDRTSTNTLRTLTNWESGLRIRGTRVENIARPLEFVILSLSVDITGLKNQMLCRFFLYDQMSHKYLSCPASLTVIEGTKYNIVFDELELRHISSEGNPAKPDNLWLVVYTYDLISAGDDQSDIRKFVSCGCAKLSKMRIGSDPFAYFGRTETIQVWSQTTAVKSARPSLHTLLIHSDFDRPNAAEKTISGYGPTLSCKFTPYRGRSADVIRNQSIENPQVIIPINLPAQVPPNLTRNMLTIILSTFTLEANQTKARLIVRLLDTERRQFVPGIENIGLLAYDSVTWSSPLIRRRRKVFEANETFAIDLTVANSPLTSLYIVVQIDKSGLPDIHKLQPHAYGIIPLTTELGSFTLVTNATIALHPLLHTDKGIVPSDFTIDTAGLKQIGSISYILQPASTVTTQNESLYKMLNLKQFHSSLNTSLENFMFSGISEWSKFARVLLGSLCEVIATSEDQTSVALNTIQAMFAELLSKGAADHSQIINDFIVSYFDPQSKDPEFRNLPVLCDRIMPLIVEQLNEEASSQRYRTCIKTIPCIMQIIARSFALEPNDDRRDRVRDLFHHLNVIVRDESHMPWVVTNQRLLLQNLATFADDLLFIFSPVEAAAVLSELVDSIRSDTPSMIRAKLRLLHGLVHSRIWFAETQDQMRVLYSRHINDAIAHADDSDKMTQSNARRSSLTEYLKTETIGEHVYRVVSELLFTSRDEFIISLISDVSTKATTPRMTQLAFMVAFLFPARFPLNVLVCLSYSTVPPCLQLFVFLHVLVSSQVHLREKLAMNENGIFNIFFHALDLAKRSSVPDGPLLDFRITSWLYTVNGNYSILRDLYSFLPTSLRLNFDIGHAILQAYFSFEATDLRDWYYLIISADIELHGHCTLSEQRTLELIYAMRSHPRVLPILTAFFAPDATPMHEAFSAKFRAVLGSIVAIETIPRTRPWQDERSEAILRVLDFAVDSGSASVHFELLQLLYQLNIDCDNQSEAAVTLSECLSFVPCDDTPFTNGCPFPPFTAQCGRDLQVELLFAIVRLFHASGHHEHALPYLSRLVATCIIPFQHGELMRDVLELKSSLYAAISSPGRVFPTYVTVAYAGAAFSPALRGRTFVYRFARPAGFAALMDDLRTRFPTVVFSPDAAADTVGAHVRFVNVVPCHAEETADPFHVGDWLRPRYVAEFALHARPSLFRAEVAAGGGSAVRQLFFATVRPFPATVARIEADPTAAATRELAPPAWTRVTIRRATRQIRLDSFWPHRLCGVPRLDPSWAARLASTLAATVRARLGHAALAIADQMGIEEAQALRVDLDEHITAIDEAFALLQRLPGGTSDSCEGFASAIADAVTDLRQQCRKL
jgi:hypothetical protein